MSSKLEFGSSFNRTLAEQLWVLGFDASRVDEAVSVDEDFLLSDFVEQGLLPRLNLVLTTLPVLLRKYQPPILSHPAQIVIVNF
mmetsp:Transcript_29108/g.43872  ORF Transcript_29108/g.43872 Transcript_29108/m.43872 type:complete len:84 (+) Transcript_29108:536-787(+)